MKELLISLFVFLILTPITIANNCPPLDSTLEKIFISGGPEINLETIALDLRPMNDSIIREAKSGKSFDYWVDEQDQIRFSDKGSLPKDDSSFIVLQDNASKDGHIIKEWGQFYYDRESKNYSFKPKNSWDLQAGEIDGAIRKQTNLKYNRVTKPNLEKARVLKCTDLLERREQGKTILKDNLISSSVVTIAGFTTSEIINPTNKTLAQKATLLSADLGTSLVGSAITSKVIKPLIVNNANIFKDLAHRTFTDLGINFAIKRPIYNAIDSDHKQNEAKIGDKLIPYDTTFGLVRFLPKRALDRWMVNSLPTLMLNSCLNNSAINFIVGPRMIRTIDRFAWSIAYMEMRKPVLEK